MEITKTYPFKFLDSYTRNDVEIFHGRNDEIQQLYEMVFASNLILVYGASGTGKTSLIQCGLASRFQTHDWLDLTVRWNQDILVSLRQAIDQALHHFEIEDGFATDQETSALKESTGNRSIFENQLKALFLGSFKPIYLIFDQFEELFILGSAEEQQAFIEELMKLLSIDLPLKMIFCIREEYLGHLSQVEKLIPSFMAKKLRVEPMDYPKTREVLINATSAPTSIISIPEEAQKEVSRAIFDKVKGKDKSLYIQLPYLQVYLNKLYEQIKESSQGKLNYIFSLDEIKKLGDIEDVLREFLEDEVSIMRESLGLSEEDLWSVLSYFASLEGTKEPVTREKLTQAFAELNDKMDTLLSALVSKKILREVDDGKALELSHDSLAQKIAEKRSEEDIAQLEIRRMIKGQVTMDKAMREMFSEQKLLFMEPFLPMLRKRNLIDEQGLALIENSWKDLKRQKLEKANEQKIALEAEQAKNEILKKSLRVNRRLSILASFIAILAILFGSLFFRFYRENQEKINTIQRTARINAAQKLMDAGNQFKSVESFADAKDSYTKALDIIKDYPEDPLYQELKKLIKE